LERKAEAASKNAFRLKTRHVSLVLEACRSVQVFPQQNLTQRRIGPAFGRSVHLAQRLKSLPDFVHPDLGRMYVNLVVQPENPPKRFPIQWHMCDEPWPITTGAHANSLLTAQRRLSQQGGELRVDIGNEFDLLIALA